MSNIKRIDKSLFTPDLVLEIEGKRDSSVAIDWNDIVNKPQLADDSWRGPVANPESLPISGNEEGDVRLSLSDGGVYQYTSSLGWDYIGANDTNIDWDAIQAKPITFPATAHGHTLDEVTETTSKKIMTDAERTKLASVATNANLYVHPSTHPASIIVESVDKRFMLDAERTKLSGVAVGANNYLHPSTHPATMIVEDSTHRFATDAEKIAWNGKADQSALTTHIGDVDIHHTHANKSALDKITYSGGSGTVDLKQIETNQSAISGKVDTTTFTGHTSNTSVHVTITEKNTWNAKASVDVATPSADGLLSGPDKAKLDGVAVNANNYLHPSTHPASMITESVDKRFMLDAERTKLSGIAANANNYTHPANHAPSIITQDLNNRFVSDAEKSSWNGAVTDKHTHTNKSVLDKITQSGAESSFNLSDFALKGQVGTGDMVKSVYDPDGDGKVVSAVSADSVPWTGVSDKPSTFAPSTHNHDGTHVKGSVTITVGTVAPPTPSVNDVWIDTN